MSKTKNLVIDDQKNQNEKQQTIQYLTDLMATLQMAHFKGRLEECPLRIHESSDPNRLSVTIDLYNFDGDGKNVCEGLDNCTITFDDGTTDTGRIFCMCYEPDDMAPLTFMFSPENRHDFDIEPDSVPLAVLQNITAWLEKAMLPQPNPEPKNTPKNIIDLWTDWCMDFDDENLWLDYMVKHPKGHCNRQHMQDKWDYCYEKYGNKAAMTMFWRELDNRNRDILTEYITTQWHKK